MPSTWVGSGSESLQGLFPRFPQNLTSKPPSWSKPSNSHRGEGTLYWPLGYLLTAISNVQPYAFVRWVQWVDTWPGTTHGAKLPISTDFRILTFLLHERVSQNNTESTVIEKLKICTGRLKVLSEYMEYTI